MISKLTKSYLRANVAVEPIIDNWYAWPHLVPPATAARNLTERHLPIMESYVADPAAHSAASREPQLAGGPFINYERDRVDDIIALCDRMRSERRDLIEFSSALEQLDRLLAERALGFSLQPLYQQIPQALRGYIELGYDTRNQASFRLIEPLLFRSPYYHRSAQSFALSLIEDDTRSFIFSTPRLEQTDQIHWQQPFDSPLVDELFGFKSKPACLGEIGELLGLPACSASILKPFVTDEALPESPRYTGPGLRWTYFGHACVLVESQGYTLLTDPAISYPLSNASGRPSFAHLPHTIDFVLLTHAHQDHVLLETLLPLRSRIGTILVPKNSGGSLQDPSLKLTLEACGFTRVKEMDELEEIACGAGTIQAIPFLGEHCDLQIRSKACYLARFGGHSLLFLADSRNIEPEIYHRVHEITGNIDTIFIGMECDGAPLSWIYGPLLLRRPERAMDQSRRANASDYASARSIVQQFRCRELYVYAMGMEPWLNFISSIRYGEDSNPIIESNRLINAVRECGIHAERLYESKRRVLT